MKKTIWIICIFLFLPAILYGQELAIKSFHLAEKDLTANTPGTLVHDQNGNVCALIKVETTQKGFTFDVGVLGVTSVVEQAAEIWVYVPFGVRKMTIQHPQLGLIRDYPFPCSIERGRTYIMKLTSGTVKTIVEHTVSKQFLYIELNPAESILEINGKIKATNNGKYQELLSFGKYNYKAYCKDYHDLIGVIEISDPDNTHNLNINLKPAFGQITISQSKQPDIADAAVYIDGKYAGNIPINNLKISSGEHTIKIIKEFYEAYNGSFNISDEENKILAPILTPDFADVSLKTNSESNIYINGEYKSQHKWSGKLAFGSYIFESRQNGHISSTMSYEVTRNDHGKTIVVPDPTPIYGSLIISSEPSKAKISINGKHIGETPKYIGKQVIGEYSVNVSSEGYESQTKTIKVTESNETTVSFSLKKQNIKNEIVPTNTANNGQRTITSQHATIYIGEIIDAKLPEGRVESWEIEGYKATYVTCVSKKSIRAIKEGSIQLWGYVNGSPKLFKFDIKKGSKQASPINMIETSQNKRMIYSKEAKVKVGERIYATLSDGFVERWDIVERHSSNYMIANDDGSITAIKEGSVRIWGYINDNPRYFTFEIVASDDNIADDKPPYKVTSKTFSMKVGDHIIAKLTEGEVTTWNLEKHNKDYFSLDQNILTAKKEGKVRIWGRINGKPKLFEITITQ